MGETLRPVTGGPEVSLPTPFGVFRVRAWRDPATAVEHLSLQAPGSAPRAGDPLVRVHSECLTGDVFGSRRCDCGEQLQHALLLMQREGGTLLYLRGQEGRGIGLANKIAAYSLQDAGADTVEANEQLGLPVDDRDYSAAAGILHALGLHRIALLSNNPAKQRALRRHGIEVAALVAAGIPARDENRFYLQTKRDRLHHTLDLNPTPGEDTPS